MIPSTRIIHLHELLTDINEWEWALFVWGAVAGILIWRLLYSRVLVLLFARMKVFFKQELSVMALQCGVGIAIIIANLALLNYGELSRSFELFAFGLTGIFFGLWIFIPADSSSA